MEQDQTIVSIELGLDALRVMHRAINQAYENWPGGRAEEQEYSYWIQKEIVAALRATGLSIEA